MALGARSPRVLRHVLCRGARFALAGAAAGCGVSLVAARWIQPLLFRESATDPVVVGVVLLVALVREPSLLSAP